MSQQLLDWAKQALEMLNDNHHLVADNEKHRYVMMHLDVIKRGKALLEQPAPVQEPHDSLLNFVCHLIDNDEGETISEEGLQRSLADFLAAHTTPPAQPAPVAIPDKVRKVAQAMKKDGYRGPLAWASKVIDFVADYTPPAAQPAVPLTPHQICEMGLVHGMSNLERFYYELGVLDAEAHHGITAAPEKCTP
jgi:hypothetical protein